MRNRAIFVLGIFVVLVMGVSTPGAAAADTAAGGLKVPGNYLEDCYYSGGYLGCSYFYGNSEPEIFQVCDLVNDGRYTVGRIKYGGVVFESPLVYYGCWSTSLSLAEGTHVGIHTGVAGLGWTDYEYGYA